MGLNVSAFNGAGGSVLLFGVECVHRVAGDE